MAKYRENTTWLQCPEYNHVDYYIYEKTNIPKEDTEHHLYLENIGYECPAYMRYIIDHYDSLPDMVYFVHGNPYEHYTGFGNAVTEVENEDFYIFSIWNWRFRRSGWPHYWPHQGFGPVMDRVYNELFGSEPPDQLQTYFNGQFMASRDAIRRHPPSFYRKILELTTTRRDRTAYSWGSKGDGWMEVCINCFNLLSRLRVLTLIVVLCSAVQWSDCGRKCSLARTSIPHMRRSEPTARLCNVRYRVFWRTTICEIFGNSLGFLLERVKFFPLFYFFYDRLCSFELFVFSNE